MNDKSHNTLKKKKIQTFNKTPRHLQHYPLQQFQGDDTRRDYFSDATAVCSAMDATNSSKRNTAGSNEHRLVPAACGVTADTTNHRELVHGNSPQSDLLRLSVGVLVNCEKLWSLSCLWCGLGTDRKREICERR